MISTILSLVNPQANLGGGWGLGVGGGNGGGGCGGGWGEGRIIQTKILIQLLYQLD